MRYGKPVLILLMVCHDYLGLQGNDIIGYFLAGFTPNSTKKILFYINEVMRVIEKIIPP